MGLAHPRFPHDYAAPVTSSTRTERKAKAASRVVARPRNLGSRPRGGADDEVSKQTQADSFTKLFLYTPTKARLSLGVDHTSLLSI